MNETTENIREWFTIFTLIVLLFIIFSIASQRDQLKSEAVKYGAAEWVVNKKTGYATFHWKHKANE